MIRSMFRALDELKPYVVVDKLLETTSTANYSKSTHKIKNVHMQNISLLLLYNLLGSLLVQSDAATHSKKSDSTITIIANNKTVISKSTRSGGGVH